MAFDLQMAQKYDIIIVGAGHNGLVAGAYLARAGPEKPSPSLVFLPFSDRPSEKTHRVCPEVCPEPCAQTSSKADDTTHSCGCI